MGRNIQIVKADTAAKPDVAIPLARKLIEQDKVDILLGEIASNVALALSEFAQSAGVVFIAGNPYDSSLTGKKANRCTFRLGISAEMVGPVLAKHLLKYGKKWFFIAPDYAYGHSAQAALAEVLTANSGTVVGVEFTPFPNASGDFTPQLTKAKNSDADVLVLGVAGSDLINCMKQVVQFGVDKKFKAIGGPNNALEFAVGYGAENNRGYWAMAWSPDYGGPGSASLARKLLESGAPYPSAVAYLGWLCAQAALTGIAKARTTDAAKLVRALEDMTFEGARKQPCKLRACDHQNEISVLIAEALPQALWNFPGQYFRVIDEAPPSTAIVPCAKNQDAQQRLKAQTVPAREGYTAKTA